MVSCRRKMPLSALALLAMALAASLPCPASAWDEAELEIFDLVDEVSTGGGGTFYEYMGIAQDATLSQVKRAYRSLSLKLHPDKSDAEDAELKFRWLASIYEVLRDKEKREVYDRVLVEGLPDWRTPVFYYRRMRKMGLAEGLAYIFAIVTVCQYFVNWAAYWERKFTLREALGNHAKKLQKKVGRKGQSKEEMEAIDKAMAEEELNLLGPRPTCYDTLPFQLFRGCKWLVLAIPSLPSEVAAAVRRRKEAAEAEAKRVQEEEEEQRRKEEKREERKEQRQRRKKVERYKDRTGEAGYEKNSDSDSVAPEVDAFKQPANALQMWTDQDLAKLARLMKKYPTGTVDRWEKIAEIMERLPWEVTKMASKVKNVAYQVSISKSAQGVTGLESGKMVKDDVLENQEQEDAEEDSDEEDSDEEEDSDDENYGVYSVASKEDYVPVEVKTKKKTKGGKQGQQEEEENGGGEEKKQSPSAEESWSQVQQQSLEAALKQFPKGTTERWDRIASKVPGKGKEQCMARFKVLAENIKKKKEQQQQQQCENGGSKAEATA